MARFISVIIVAAGNSSRMGKELDKKFIKIGGRAVLAHTVLCFAKRSDISEIIIVTKSNDFKEIKQIISELDIKQTVKFASGGATRGNSVKNGFKECSEKATDILIHDGARPFVEQATITSIIDKLKQENAVIAAVKVKDTLKKVQENYIQTTLNRDEIISVQTPQGFSYSAMSKMYDNIDSVEKSMTDDASLAERLGIAVSYVTGSYYNLKITTPEDLVFAEAIYKFREESDDENRIRL